VAKEERSKRAKRTPVKKKTGGNETVRELAGASPVQALRKFTIGFVGLGKLGLPIAEAIAERHPDWCTVIGHDIRPVTTNRVKFTSSIQEIAALCDLVFVTVQTPHDPAYDGSIPAPVATADFNYAHVELVLRQLDDAGARGTVVLVSTVLPGTIRSRLWGILNDRMVYNPFFTAMGTEVRDFFDPEFVVIGTCAGGESDAPDLAQFYRQAIPGIGDRLRFVTMDEAECVKVFYNTFIGLKIAFANTIQDACTRMVGADVDAITSVLSLADRRLFSPSYMKAGLGDGGPCHPRDNIALKHLSRRLGMEYDLFGAVVGIREAQARELAHAVSSWAIGSLVVIIGKSYKPGVPVEDGSYSKLVAHYLEKECGRAVAFHDPALGLCEPPGDEPRTYLLAHDTAEARAHPFNPGSSIVDPWRGLADVGGCRVFRYGSSR
jgi:UDPglucose 6-dehydrogenase